MVFFSGGFFGWSVGVFLVWLPPQSSLQIFCNTVTLWFVMMKLVFQWRESYWVGKGLAPLKV